MNDVLKRIEKIGIVPVVKLDDAKNALPLANALIRGGLPLAEITFRTAEAQAAISLITKEYPEMLIGAGTVLTTEQVDKAVSAGAKFIVTPGFNPKVVKYCVDKNIPIAPGCPTSSDIEAALDLGLDVVKFFPAENLGGVNMIKALSAPYVGLKFMPTGGINEKNLNSYLSCDKVLACGGSWMVKDALINAGKFDEIENLTREAVKTSLGFKLGHVAINCENGEKAAVLADLFTDAFGFPKDENPVSYFLTSGIEIMKNDGAGENGHIAIQANNVERAADYLRRNGIELDDTSAKYDKNGKLNFIYLKRDFGGFRAHLCGD